MDNTSLEVTLRTDFDLGQIIEPVRDVQRQHITNRRQSYFIRFALETIKSGWRCATVRC